MSGGVMAGQSSLLIVLLIVLVVAILVLLGFVLYLMTRRDKSRHFTKIGSYQIKKELPPGGMSRIFLASRSDGREVIVKIPLKSGSLTEKEKISFLREGDFLKHLQHPHIVGLEEYGVVTIGRAETCFLALEYVPGQNLDRLIAEGRRFSISDACLIVASVAEGLAAAHSKETPIVHRDVSANNIILTMEGITGKRLIKLLDFGVAKWDAGSDGHTARDMMKEKYASPEQIGHDELDARTDIFSLGVVFYELLTGKKPFEGWERKTLPPPPSAMGIAIDPFIDSLVMEMLTLDRDRRTADLNKVVKIIGSSMNICPLGGELYREIAHTGPEKVQQTKSFVIPRPLLIGLVAGIAGLTMVGILMNVKSRSSRPFEPVPNKPGPAIEKPQQPVPIPQAQSVAPSPQPESLPPAPTPASAKQIELFCFGCGKKLEGKGFKACPFCGVKLPKKYWGE